MNFKDYAQKGIINDTSPKKINHFEMDMPQHSSYDKMPLIHSISFSPPQKKPTYLH